MIVFKVIMRKWNSEYDIMLNYVDTIANEDYVDLYIDNELKIVSFREKGVMGRREVDLDNYNEIIVDGRTVYKQGEN